MDIEREIELIFNKVGLDNRKQTQKEVIALIYKYTEALQLLQADVSNRRELLKAFQDHYQSDKFDDERTFDWNIDNFLKAFNCG